MIVSVGACASQDDPSPDKGEVVSRQVEDVDLGSFFEGMEGTFVVVDPQRDVTRVYNRQRAETRFIPVSTFKIPNSLIALETGVADDAGFALPWDSTATPPDDWWPRSWRRDQTMRTAFQHSVFWFYQELARRIGEQRMQEYVHQFEYGNEDIGGGIDQFWLHGDIRISPLEQVDFLERFYNGKLGVSDRSTRIVKDIMVLEDSSAFRLSGKTGTGDVTPTRELGWLVGYLEKGDDVYYYALNMEGERVWEDWPPQKRKVLVLELFEALGVIGERPPGA